MEMSRAILEALSGRRWDDGLYGEPPKVDARDWPFDKLKTETLRLVHGEGGYSLQHATAREHVLFLHSLRELARKELVEVERKEGKIVAAKIGEKGLALLRSGEAVPEVSEHGVECPRCGYRNDEQAALCATCGEKLSRTEQEVAREEAAAYFKEKRGRKFARFDRHTEEFKAEAARLRRRYMWAILSVFVLGDLIVEFSSYCHPGILLGSLTIHGLLAYGAVHVLASRGGGQYLGMICVTVFYLVGTSLRGTLGLTVFGPGDFLMYHMVFGLWVPAIGGFVIGIVLHDAWLRQQGAG